MKTNIYLALICVLSLLSCDEQNETVAIKNEIRVNVYNTETWSSATNKMNVATGATVYLISDSETLTALVDNNGVATFKEVKENEYYIIASKESLGNLINKSTIDGKTVGHLIIGVYTSQEDIDYSALYSEAVIGGIKLADMNSDGIINDIDKVEGDYLNFEYQYKDINADGIIDVHDILNGSLVQIDSQIEKDIFIGS